MKAYRVTRVQALKEEDYARRLEFCEWALGMYGDDPEFLLLLLFTDEAKFFLNGAVSSAHAYHYSTQNNHEFVEQPLDRRGVMMWAGISRSCLIGPFSFDENVNQRTYEAMLQEHLIPALQRPEFLNKPIYFMQDGAPAHRARGVMTASRHFR